MRMSMKLATVLGLNTPISQRILATQPANLIGYWPLGETAGTVAKDYSPTAANGAYAGTFTLNQPGIGDGSRSTLFAGGRVSLATNIAALSAVFSGNEGSVAAWCSIPNPANWTDASVRAALEIGADVNNRILLEKTTTNNQIGAIVIFGGTEKDLILTVSPFSSLFHMACTWSKSADRARFYVNGALAASASSLGTFAGSLSSTWTAIADFNSAGSNPWLGGMAHVPLWKIELTAAEVARIAIL